MRVVAYAALTALTVHAACLLTALWVTPVRRPTAESDRAAGYLAPSHPLSTGSSITTRSRAFAQASQQSHRAGMPLPRFPSGNRPAIHAQLGSHIRL